MASVQTSSYQGRYLKLTVTEESTSITNNTSTIRWTLESIGGSSTYYTIFNCKVVVNGDTVYNPGTVRWDSYDFPAKKGSISDTMTITHKSDGTADPVEFELHGRVYVSGDEDLHGTLNLSTIPRYTSISSFTVSKRDETSFTFNWRTADTIDYVWYSTNNGSSWNGYDVTDGTSGSFVVSGLSANTSYNCKLRVRRKDSQLNTDSGTVAQTTYKVPSHSLNSKTETSIVMNWSCDSTVDYIWYSRDNGSNWTGVDVTDGTSGTYTISGLSANTAYNIKTRVRRKATQTTYDTGALSVTTYNYPHITAVETANLTIGNQQKLTLYNPLSRSVTVKMYKDSTSGTQLYSGTTTGTSITFTPAASTLYESIPSASSAKCVYSAIYSSSTKTTTDSYTYKIKGTEVPTFSNFTYQDTNGTTTALTGNNQILVKGYSNVKATISTANKATANNSATMRTKDCYKLVVGSKQATADYSSSAEVELNASNVDSGTITVYATDSRGLSKSVAKTTTIKNYADLVIKSVSATRGNNGVGQAVTLSFNGTYWNDNFGSVTNSIKSIKYYYKETTSSTWLEGATSLSVSTSGSNWSGSASIKGDLGANGFDVSKSYNIRLQVSDELVTKTYDVVLTSGTPAMAIYKANLAVGKKYDTSKGGALQVGGDEVVDGQNIVYGRSYLEGKVRHHQGTYVQNFNAGHGTSGYIKICTFTIGATYQNMPIIFGVIQRTRYGRIIVQFQSSADTKPSSVSVFQSSGAINPYIVKTGDSTWDLYIQKSEAYDQIEITELYKGEYANGITITWKNEIATSLPSGAINAGWEEYGINARYATNAGSATTATTATTANDLSDTHSYTRSGVREEDWGSTWLRTHSFIGSVNASGWRSLINVRHRGGGGDGNNYGLQIVDDAMTSASWNLLTRKQYGGTWTSWETIPRRVNLYNNTSGATGTITLSQSAANFSFLRIYAMTSSENYRISVDVYSPDGKTAYLLGGWQSGASINYKSACVKISGTSITRASNGFFGIGNGGSATVNDANVILILRVDGYK